MCGGDIGGIIPHLGARVGHPTWGTGTKIEDSCINQGRLGLGDSVQLVISDPLWPTGKNDLSHSLVFCHSPSQGLVNWPWILHRAGWWES